MSRFAAIVTLLIALGAQAQTPARAEAAKPVPLVAAENFYGDVAKQIGGDDVAVTSILNNPDQDPHLFEASPSMARTLSGARVVIYNGADYDPWMPKLLSASRGKERAVINAADLVGKKPGDNPHLWYDPAVMSAVAAALTSSLCAADPDHAVDYEHNLAAFQTSMQPVQIKVAALRNRLAGTPVTATEPVFGAMFEALGMSVRNVAFQRAVMNNTEPAASDIAAFERDLKTHQVKLLVFNSQASSPVAARMEQLAHAAQVPVVGATETEPAGTTYQAWMMAALTAVDHALPQ